MYLRAICSAVLTLLALAACTPSPTIDVSDAEPVADRSNRPNVTKGETGPPASDVTENLILHVLGDTEDVWDALFRAMLETSYPRPSAVLFSGSVNSACGMLRQGARPAYCPADRKIYIDPAFLRERSEQVGEGGDFTQAYLIAQAVGHHVLNVLGVTQRFDRIISETPEVQRGQMRVSFELQTDCYAGVWTHFVGRRGLLEPADLKNGLPAAFTIGDPALFGEPMRRRQWFEQGFKTGDSRQCEALGKVSN